jgi:hypothetical protein
MESNNLTEWLKIVGLFSIAVSLMFTGSQSNQTSEQPSVANSHDIAASAIYQAKSDTEIQLLSALLESSRLQTALTKLSRNKELTPMEQTVMDFVIRQRFTYWDNQHYQFTKGFIAEESWNTTLKDMQVELASKPYKNFYSSNPGIWRESFSAVVESI